MQIGTLIFTNSKTDRCGRDSEVARPYHHFILLRLAWLGVRTATAWSIALPNVYRTEP